MTMRPWIGPGLALAVAVAVASGIALGQTPDPQTGVELTLTDAVAEALRSNPMAVVAERGIDAARARLDQAKAARLPTLGFGETFTHGNNPVFVFGSLLEQGRFAERNFALDSLNNPGSLSNFRSSVNLAIPLLSRRRIQTGIEQARLGTQIAGRSADWVDQNIRFQAIEAFFGTALARARVHAARQAVDSAEADAQRIRDLVEEGLRVDSDLLSAQVQLAEFRQALIQAEGAEESARAALNTVLGRPVDSPLRPAGGMPEKRYELAPQAQLIERASRQRPDLQQSAANVEIAHQKARSSRGEYLPAVNLFAQFGQSSQELVGGSGDFTVGATLSFNILDFGRSPRIQEAMAEWEIARGEELRQRNQVGLEVVRAYREVLAAESRVEVSSGAVGQAEEALRIVEDRHQEGLTTVTELLRAQTALLNSRFNLLAARYDYILGFARVLLATGELEDASVFTR